MTSHHAWAHVLMLEPADLPFHPEFVIDQWHVVHRTGEAIRIIGWESPGQWEPVLSEPLAAFDVVHEVAIDVNGKIYQLERAAEDGMHPKVADHLERMSRPGAMPR